MDINSLVKVLPEDELAQVRNFRDALSEEDRKMFDEVLAGMNDYFLALRNKGKVMPLEALLVAMVIQERKQITHLQSELERLQSKR